MQASPRTIVKPDTWKYSDPEISPRIIQLRGGKKQPPLSHSGAGGRKRPLQLVATDAEVIEAGKKARVEVLVGKWDIPCDVCDFLELWLGRDGKLQGRAMVAGCDVVVWCKENQEDEITFHAQFETLKRNFLGTMTVAIEDYDTLLVTIDNRTSGDDHIMFSARVTRKK